MPRSVKLLASQVKMAKVDAGVKKDVKLYQGGFGSGKTAGGAILAIMFIRKRWGDLKPDTMRVLVCASVSRILRKGTIPQWLKALRLLGYKPKEHYVYFSSQNDTRIVFRCYGDAEVSFQSLDDPMNIRGGEYQFIHADEASLLSQQAFYELIGRLRGNLPCLRMVLTTNPQAQKGWVYEEFVTKAGRFTVKDEATGEEVLCNKERIIAPTKENPHNGPGYAAFMRQMFSPSYARMVVDGEDGDFTEGLVVKNFTSENVQAVEYDPAHRLHLTCDFNVDPNMWLVAQRINGQYHFIDEIVKEHTTVEECVDEFVARYPVDEILSGLTINGDASGSNRHVNSRRIDGEIATSYKLIKNRLYEHGMERGQIRLALRAANPPIVDRIEAFNAKICNAEGRVFIKINPKCRWLLYNMRNLKFKEGAGDIETYTAKQMEADRNRKFLGHIYDAASYMVEYYDPIKTVAKPEPLRSDILPSYRNLDGSIYPELLFGDE